MAASSVAVATANNEASITTTANVVALCTNKAAFRKWRCGQYYPQEYVEPDMKSDDQVLKNWELL